MSAADEAPNDPTCEACVLSGMLLDPLSFPKVAAIVRPDDFYVTDHQKVFLAAVAVTKIGDPCDELLVLRRLEADGVQFFDRVDDKRVEIPARDFIAALVKGGVESAANVEAYARRVQALAHKRELLRVAERLRRASLNGVAPTEAAADAAQGLSEASTAYAPATQSLIKVVKVSETDQTPYLVRGLLSAGSVTVIHAIPKLGKTTFVYGMLAAVQRGDPAFCGLAIPATCDALVLSEESSSVLAETFRALGVDPNRAPAISRSDAFPRLSLAAYVSVALAHLAKTPSCRVVVIDTYRFWAQQKDENDAAEAGRHFAELYRLAATGAAVVVVHHSRKAGGEDGISASGSTGITGAGDIEIEIKRFGAGESRTLRQVEVRGRLQRLPDPFIANYDVESGRYALVADASTAKDRIRDDRVRTAIVRSEKWLTSDEVAAVTGMKDAHAVAALRALSGRHEIQLIKGGLKGTAKLYAGLNVPLHTQPRPPESTES